MHVHEYFRVLRARWRWVAAVTAVVTLTALAGSLISTPVYQASTRLFVSMSVGTSVGEALQGNQLSQQLVTSYARLLTGTTLAQRTIDSIGADRLGGMSANALASEVTATAAPGTVLLDVSVQDTSPERARDIANALSDEFVAMVRELGTPADGGAAPARVIVEQRAEVPTTATSPKTTRNLLLGSMIGLLLGIAAAVIRDRTDNRLTAEADIEEIVGSAVVGAVPFDRNRETHAAVNFTDGYSVEAEAYRELRTNLRYISVDNPPRVIVVTSPLPAEGKTTTSVNIALVLSESGKKVCLVDGDLRKPRISAYLGIIGTVGLSSVLSGQATLDEVLQPVGDGELSVLAAGVTPPNPSELLGSDTTRALFDELRTRFDYVIVDASPLLPVTDAAVLSTVADGALIAVRHGSTKRDELSTAVGNLNAVGARIIGSVLTMAPGARKGVDPYGYYYSDRTDSAAVSPELAAADPVGVHVR
ncbi:succinoglycan biosynthesis transport protein ExoP [Rhodococcus sp. 27YEA15]|uniref:polysaccharide biosynthesis tyrosine autokinase n=1 Tax=Rhodococcus sp. 27YEA15 TaxID=3156259 RepID=UPI003C7C9670